MVIKYRFKFYPHIVCDDNKTLWQLEHFKNKRTFPLKKLVYNADRKAFRINSQWVSKRRLLNLKIPANEVLVHKQKQTLSQNLANQIKQILINHQSNDFRPGI